MKLRRSHFLKVLHLVHHLFFAYGLIYYSKIWLILTFVGWFFVGSLGISICYHRSLSHQSVHLRPWFLRFFSLLGCFATGGSPIAWVGAHRLHHAYADRERDPHSWKFIGFIKVYTHRWRPFSIPHRFVKDLIRDPWLVFLHQNYFTIILLATGAAFLWSVPVGIFLFSGVSVCAFHAFGMINVAGHSHGYRSYEVKDLSTNSWIANILTWGEGWHNNHHRFPNSYRIGIKNYEFDPSARVIEILSLAKAAEESKH